ncbi:MAG: 2-oxo acid dehydrogenase subunit E2 [Saprospiraceae bacterium]
MNDHFEPNNAWRKTAAAIYRKPVDSKIFGTVDLDVTDLEAFVLEKRQQGLRITLMHPLILFLARGIKTEVPELNCYVRRGNIVPRKHVDVAVSVLVRGGTQMGAVIVPAAETLSLVELADFLAQEVPKARRGKNKKGADPTELVAAIPWPLRGWCVGLIKWLTIDVGVSLPGLGLSPDKFGSFVFSNLGSIGLDVGYPALFPASNVGMVLNMGNVQSKPVVVGDQIVPRRILCLSAAIDHRIVDAAHVGTMFRYMKEAIKGPINL